MPIINYEDYYKPSKPQPKAPTKYYQPPKPKAATPPRYTDYSQGKYGSAALPPDIRQTGIKNVGDPLLKTVKDVGTGMFDFFFTNPLTAIGMGANWAGTQLGTGFEKLWQTAQNQQDRGYAYPLDSTMAAAPPTFNTSREPARGAYGLPATTNIVDRTKWQRSLENWWMLPSVRETPPNTSYMPSFPSYAEGKAAQLQQMYGMPAWFMPVATSISSPWVSATAMRNAGQAAPAYTAYSQGRYANPTRMGGTSSVGMYSDTGGVSAGAAQSYPPVYKAPWAGVPAGWTTTKSPGASYKRETLAELLARGAVDPWASDPYEIGGAGTDWGSETQEPVYEGDGGGYGWGGGWGGGGGGSASYGASSGVNSYLPGTRAGYGASASSPRYNGYGGARASSYAGAQSMNQAAWRMPMLVWNI